MGVDEAAAYVIPRENHKSKRVFILATTLLDRYENEIEFMREGNVKGPLEMDSRSGFA